jgi:dihydrofolate synthase/folylpolyglutamate synthase
MQIQLADMSLRMLGRHQGANAAAATATVLRLAPPSASGWEPAIRRGLRDVCLPARVEIASRRPWVIVDTAHNVASIEALLDALEVLPASARRILIFAASRDKDVAGMLAQLLPRFDQVVLTRFLNNPRATPPDELYALALRVQSNQFQVAPAQLGLAATPWEAWTCCQQSATADDLVCITGSFFLAAEMGAWARAGRLEAVSDPKHEIRNPKSEANPRHH